MFYVGCVVVLRVYWLCLCAFFMFVGLLVVCVMCFVILFVGFVYVCVGLLFL